MKNKSLILITLMLLTVAFTGCEEDIELPVEDKGAVISLSNIAGFFDKTDDASVFSFDAGTLGEAVTSFDILKSYNGGGAVLHSSGNTASTLNITLAEALNGLGVSIDDLVIGDAITFSFDNVATPSGSYPSGVTASANVACSSSLAGTHSHVTTTSGWCTETATGEVTWSEISPGQYAIDDFAFNTYSPCYNSGNTPDGTLAVNDVCNAITITGASQWDEIYTWSISNVSGTTMVISWSNDYGENGVTTITNGNGEDWPPLFTP